jgi:hypothetical protein
MTDEIAWIADSEDPVFVFFREKDTAHYFYWPKEYTFPGIIKYNDLEPIRVKGNYGISRYHYHGITVWIDPRSDSGKPIVKFVRNFHTPNFLPSPNKKVKRFLVHDPPNMTEGDPDLYFLASRYERTRLKYRHNNNFKSKKGYSDYLVKEVGNPLEKVSELFDSDYVRNFALELIVIGEEEKITKLVDDIKDIGNTKELTSKSIASYFGFS